MVKTATTRRIRAVEKLENRLAPAAVASFAAGVMTVTGDAANDNITVTLEARQIVVRSDLQIIGKFATSAVTSIMVNAGDGNNRVSIDPNITVSTILTGGSGRNIFRGGGGPTTLVGGSGSDKLIAGSGVTNFNGNGGADLFVNVKPADTAITLLGDRVVRALPVIPPPGAVNNQLTVGEVNQLLARAAAATASTDGIITIVDRGGRLLGLKVEAGVDPGIVGNPDKLVFAVDGSLALARTGAFFGNNQAPLTSRTVGFISQTTMTQREIQSNPSITDPNSTLRGPGFVAAIGINGHFPPDVPFTPQVDLFAIEYTNRDSIIHPGADRIKGTADDIVLPSRFNVPAAFATPGMDPPESYGLISGLRPNAQSRGLGTLPGGIPIYKNGEMVGGIGVFFPGKTGWASEENSALDALYDPSKPDRSLEAEYMAFAAVGGTTSGQFQSPIGNISGLAPVAGVGLPSGRIDLVGVTLDIFGPGGVSGQAKLVNYGRSLGEGADTGVTNVIQAGKPVPDGWLVKPHDGEGITATEVEQIINQGIAQANRTRAAIRLPFNTTTKMVFAVSDRSGNIVGLFRMPDSTVFSIDVAVAKARNVAYYSNPSQLQSQDMVEGIPPGTALTARSFRYLALPRFPEGIEGRPPGPFSILTDPGANPNTGLQVGPRQPASAFQSAQGFSAFNPSANFHSKANPANQNGVVFFPGSAPLYRSSSLLIGGFGVSGDGVDQDCVVTVMGNAGYDPSAALRVDNVFVRGVRIPYQKFNRNPEGGIT